jgi:hypothetical protein
VTCIPTWVITMTLMALVAVGIVWLAVRIDKFGK